MTPSEIILHLSLVEGIGPAAITTIIARKPEALAWQALHSLDRRGWRNLGVTEAQADRLVEGLRDHSLIEKELLLMDTHGIQWASILDDAYPESLRHIHCPPAVLYWRGNLSYEKAIAIVGSRDANTYGERHINVIVPSLVRHGFCIVSGGALGADTMAHHATMRARGKTIVVLGSGLLHLAPRSNRRLFEMIIEQGGAVVSAFPCNEKPFAGNFPARNRVISGLAQGIIVAQAARKSGARITAQFALEQGRDVFAIPGSIDDPLSEGCHALVQEGAKLIMNSEDVLIEYGIAASDHGQASIPFDTSDTKEPQKKKSYVQKEVGSSLQQKVVAACMHAQSIDTLAEVCNLDLSQMQKELFDMQMLGMIEQDFTGMWKSV